VVATRKERERRQSHRNNVTVKKITVYKKLASLKLPVAAVTIGSTDWKMRA